MISLIVAVAENNVIGSKNDLPWRLSADLKRFKELTTGHTVVMGRKTFESVVKRLGKPLPNRKNVVVTRSPLVYDGVTVLHDLDGVKKLNGEVFIIGGANIYEQTLLMANKLYVTEVKARVQGDTYFPVISPNDWREVSREPRAKDENNQYDFEFVVYERVV